MSGRYTRQFDPATRDTRFDARASSWFAGSPAVELVTATLCTDKGSAQRDPSWGIDLARAQNAGRNAKAEYRAAAEAALARYVTSGALRDLVIDVDTGTLDTGDAAMVVRVRCKGRSGEPVDTSITYPVTR